MKKIILFLFIFAYSTPLYADPFFNVQPAIRNESITMVDLLSFLDIDMFKYKLMLTEKGTVTVAFKDIKRNKFAFNHKIKIESHDVCIMRLSFAKDEGFPGKALKEVNETINYSLNWDYKQVFSGTIQNPLHGYDSVYSVSNGSDVGQNIEKKTSLIKFFSWEKDTDKEELIAEVFIEFEPSE